MKINKLLATATCSASLASAWDVVKNRCEKFEMDPCLTSFQWCDTHHGGCSIPPGSYPDKPASSRDIMPLLDPYMDYTISWQTSHHDAPVTIRWVIGTSGIVWETNVTGATQIIFNPSEILNAFPTPLSPNNSSAEAWYASSSQSALSLEQAGTDGDNTQPFYIGQDFLHKFLQQQRENEYDRWQKSVGLGVGLGVPILLVITAFTTWVITKRTTRKSEAKPIEMSPQ